VVLVIAEALLELEPELEPDDEADDPHATAADITAAAPRISAPRLRPFRTAVMEVTVSPLVPMGR
jgi:hypothetical protein